MDTQTTITYNKETATQIQNYLFPEGLPQWMHAYRRSPELMAILYMLYLDTAVESAVLNSTTTIDVMLHHLLCCDTRDVIRYRAVKDFTFDLGYIQTHIDLRRHETESRLRQVKSGNTLLVRVDSKLRTVEVQILRDGLFGEESSAIFTLDNDKFSKYSQYVVREQRIKDR